jgi:hypothetical protein
MNYNYSENSNYSSRRYGCKSRQQIAEEYQWRSVQTFRTKLRQNGIKLPSGSISPKWQKVIYDILGYPPGVLRKDYDDV